MESPGNSYAQHDALITDLFEKITLLDLKARDAEVRRRPDGRWDVTFTVEARKFHADGQGVQTEAPLDEEIELGVFARNPGAGDYAARDMLLLQRQRIRSGSQAIALTVDREPAFAGVDPLNKRIDRNSDDNLAAVTGR
jgi:hypothetical protein